jgi:hypothetical protein
MDRYQIKPWARLGERNIFGYVCVTIRDAAGHTRTKRVARLVLEAFVGDCPPGMQARHFPDRDKRNNSVGNLKWGTAEDNARDRDVHGTTAKGEKSGNSKLKEPQVLEIRRRCKNGEARQQIADDFHITIRALFNILARRTWKHLPE